jgi:hypothetical protein
MLFVALGLLYFAVMMYAPSPSVAGVAGPLIVNRLLDAQGKPGTLTAQAYRPALLTMVGCLPSGSWPTCSSARCPSATRRVPDPGQDGVAVHRLTGAGSVRVRP